MANEELRKVEADTKLERTRAAREVAPRVDIFENQEELLVVADMPGVDPAAVGVHWDGSEFRIEGRYAQNNGGPQLVYARTFLVDERVDAERIRADYRDGVLSVHLGKSAAFKPRRVEVRTS